MTKLNLSNIALYGADTLDLKRLMFVFKICERFADFGQKIIFTKCSTDYVTESGISVMNTNAISSVADYNTFNMKELYKYIERDFVLFVEYDGFILNPNGWTDEFLDYDFIGAPWWYKDGHNVGNGGFSLRSKKLLKILATDKNIKETVPDDRHICRTYRKYLESKGIRFAPEKLARKFSIEGALHYPEEWYKDTGNTWSNEFGFHGLHKTDISKWLALYPEYADYLKEMIRRRKKKLTFLLNLLPRP